MRGILYNDTQLLPHWHNNRQDNGLESGIILGKGFYKACIPDSVVPLCTGTVGECQKRVPMDTTVQLLAKKLRKIRTCSKNGGKTHLLT